MCEPPIGVPHELWDKICSDYGAAPDAIVGIDEVGYGAWAGPLVVGAYCAPLDWHMTGLRDSKKLNSKERADIYVKLFSEAGTAWAVKTPAEIIDKVGVMGALASSVHKIISEVRYWKSSRVVFIMDGNLDLPHTYSLVKADDKIPAVMAASVYAKHTRDDFMRTYAHALYPQYGFNRHVGYGTPRHKSAIDTCGICPEHRRSYRPIKEHLAKQSAGLAR